MPALIVFSGIERPSTISTINFFEAQSLQFTLLVYNLSVYT